MTAPHRCGRCPARWSGALTCHCSACHLTFSGLAGFDAHRQGDGCRTAAQMRAKGYQEVRPGVLGRPTPSHDPTEGHARGKASAREGQ